MEEKEMVQVSSKSFSVGDLAVYPAHGVGRIESIESKEIGGTKQDFYILKILENGMVIMIPTANVKSVGLREVIAEDDIPKIYEVMQNTDSMPGDSQTWNRRYREYMDKLKTGSIYDVAEVFRDLFLLRITKDLSFGERKLLDTAQSLLLKELCLARNADEKTMMSEIEKLFSSEKSSDK
ncbi:MAG: CarD family transcriptional regulator [Desulforegulaceae bacterium]|nr:CarD family transcriptional regulator [Desulforegulaceae bacterium]